jgi:hypothetical protein
MGVTSTSFRKGEKRPNQGKRGPDKVKQETKDALAIFVANNTERFEEWIEEIDDPARRMEIVIKALEFVRPKLARTDTHLTGTLNLASQLKELDESV